MFRVSLSFLILLDATAAAVAQGVLGAEFQLTVQPAKEPVPALKYQLAYELREQIAGNAAVHYLRAALVYEEKRAGLGLEKRREQLQQVDKWRDPSLKELPRAEMRAFFDHYSAVLDLLERAAKCKRCDWELEDSLRQEGFAALLPEVQQMRGFADLVRLKIRLELADGKFDRAANWLRIGFAMARHTSEAPTLINVLVGLALSAIMDSELKQFIQQPGAPNMYWALTDLPHPFIDLRTAFQGERLTVAHFFPGIREMATDLKAAPITSEQGQELMDKLAKLAAGKTPEKVAEQRLAVLNLV